MGLFDNAGPAVQREEFERMLSHPELKILPHQDRERLKDLADSYFDRPGHLKGIRQQDKEEFMQKAKDMVQPTYHSKLPVLDKLLDQGIKGTYGGHALGI